MNRILAIPFILLGTLISVCSCNSGVQENNSKPPFCLTDTLQQKATIEDVNLKIVKNAIFLSGKIEANEDKWVKVYPVVGGIVQEMKVQLGDYVTKGQTLAIIRSGEIADYQSQLTYAQSGVRIAEKSLNSARELFKSGLNTEKDVV